MPFLVRKIARAKWVTKDELGPNAIGADAVTSCLRTMDNALSVWECAGSERQDVMDPVLALAAALDRLDPIQVVAIDRQSVESSGIALVAAHGNTPVEDLRPTHHDLVRLHLGTLGDLARLVASAVRQDVAYYQFSKKQVRDLIVAAVRARRVELQQLKPELQRDVASAVQTASIVDRTDI